MRGDVYSSVCLIGAALFSLLGMVLLFMGNYLGGTWVPFAVVLFVVPFLALRRDWLDVGLRAKKPLVLRLCLYFSILFLFAQVAVDAYELLRG